MGKDAHKPTIIGEHETHPAADVYDMLTGSDLAGLIDDIKTHGLRFPIVLFEGRILDGRNRYAACIKAGVPPRFEQWTGDMEGAIQYAISVNHTRRHMNEWDRLLAAQRLTKLWAEMARKERRLARASQPRLPNVADATEAQFAAVNEHGTPELVAAVARGDIHMALAAQIAEHEPERQALAVAAIEADIAGAKAVRTPVHREVLTSKEVEYTHVEGHEVERARSLLARHADPGYRRAAALLARVFVAT